MDHTTRRMLIDVLRRLADDLEAEEPDREEFASLVRAALRRHEEADGSTPKGI